MDRTDLQVYVRPVPLAELRGVEPGESSAQIRARVVAARDRQLARLRPWNLRCNAEALAARPAGSTAWASAPWKDSTSWATRRASPRQRALCSRRR
jgi:predicted ATPase with chaperone activity